MRLLIALGLTLLVGGTWAQHSSFFNIDSATDLLALPSDQLIDSDIDHEAVEAIIHTANHNFEDSNHHFASTFDLPFGARLPGYDRIKYAYGYQISDKGKAKTPQSVSFPTLSLETNSPTAKQTVEAETQTETTSSPSLLDQAIKLDSVVTTTEQRPDDSQSKITSSTIKIPNTTWLNSTYFPQVLNLDLSPPEVNHASSSKLISKEHKEYHNEQNIKDRTETSFLQSSYLPPVLDFKTEPPPSPPLLSLSSYLPPDPDPVLPESKSEDIIHPPILDSSYLTPKSESRLKVEKSEFNPPLPELLYVPPNPNPLLKAADKVDPPLPDSSYLPPQTGLTVKTTDSVPEIPLVAKTSEYSDKPLSPPESFYLPPVQTHSIPEKPLILIPISLPLIKEADDNVLLPFGVIGKREDDPIIISSETISKTPTGVVSEHESSQITFTGEKKPDFPTRVIGEQEDNPVIFTGEQRNPPPAGIIGKHEDHPIRFTGEQSNPPPAGVIGEQEDNPLIFTGEQRNPPPAGIIGEHEDHPVRFTGEQRNPPPAGVIGNQKHYPVRFTGEQRNPPPARAIGDQKDYPVRFTGEQRNPPPAGIIGEHVDQQIRFSSKQTAFAPAGVIGELEDQPIRFTGDRKIPSPAGVISEITGNAIQAHSYPQPVVVAAIPKDNPACTQNGECSDEDICIDGMCVNACVIAIGLCVGNAVCHARRHIPACICPDMFTAVTIKGYEKDQYDCMPMMMMMNNARTGITQGRASLGPRQLRPIANYRQSSNSISLPPIGVLTRERVVTQSRITTGVRQDPFRQDTFRSDPCNPTPCGPNTRCVVSRNGIAQCRCTADYVPDGNTINGCKPQCTVDDDCPDDYRCRVTKCERVCVQGACGTGAECDARDHRATCKCPRNYRGDPHIRCTRERPQVKDAPPAIPLDPCVPNPCGTNADCRVRGDRAVCTCPVGYEGDPLTNCRRGECIENRDCPGHRVCQRLKCIDPCGTGVCGRNAECTVRNHQPVCSCPRRYVGDPFVSCEPFDPRTLCEPTPCGRNTKCRVQNERAVCSCIDNYIGDPLSGCYPECEVDSECPQNLACRNNICVNPCRDFCGDGAYCDVRNNRAICSCPQFYQGDPHNRCYAECTAHDDCPSYQACFELRCIDPCVGACGTNANCKVDNHKPICSCPKHMTGHPFEACTNFRIEDLCEPNPCGTNADCTPGKDREGNDRPVCTCPRGYIGNPLISCEKGDCLDHNECREHEACFEYTCQNPCYTRVGSVCGENAQCNAKNHQPVCSCPSGYDGNPIHECRISRRASLVSGRIRK